MTKRDFGVFGKLKTSLLEIIVSAWSFRRGWSLWDDPDAMTNSFAVSFFSA